MPKLDADLRLNDTDPASWRLDAPQPTPKAIDWRRHKRDDRKAKRLGNGPPDIAYWPRELHAALNWATTATDLRIAWYIQGKFSMNGEQPFPLSNEVLRLWGVTRKQKLHSLRAHRDNKTITFTEVERKAPQVTPLAAFWSEFRRKDKP